MDGVADFDALHSRRHDELVQLYAFDIFALDGDDLRGLSLSLRKQKLVRLLARYSEGIFAADLEYGHQTAHRADHWALRRRQRSHRWSSNCRYSVWLRRGLRAPVAMERANT